MSNYDPLDFDETVRRLDGIKLGVRGNEDYKGRVVWAHGDEFGIPNATVMVKPLWFYFRTRHFRVFGGRRARLRIRFIR